MDQVILIQQSGRTAHEDICRSLELFAAKVMPGFHAGETERVANKARDLAPWIKRALRRRPRVETIVEHRIPIIPAFGKSIMDEPPGKEATEFEAGEAWQRSRSKEEWKDLDPMEIAWERERRPAPAEMMVLNPPLGRTLSRDEVQVEWFHTVVRKDGDNDGWPEMVGHVLRTWPASWNGNDGEPLPIKIPEEGSREGRHEGQRV